MTIDGGSESSDNHSDGGGSAHDYRSQGCGGNCTTTVIVGGEGSVGLLVLMRLSRFKLQWTY